MRVIPTICEDIYLQVIYRKTAKLFEAAADAGAVLAGTEIQGDGRLWQTSGYGISNC